MRIVLVKQIKHGVYGRVPVGVSISTRLFWMAKREIGFIYAWSKFIHPDEINKRYMEFGKCES